MLKNRYSVLLILTVAMFFSLSLWFSANAIIPQLNDIWQLETTSLSLMSMILIFGFISGGLSFSIFNISDVIKTKNVFIISVLVGALANILPIFVSSDFEFVLVSRFIVGFSLAGVYPVIMKLTATWFKKDRGFAIGIVLGALTLGSGLPYIFNLTSIPDWRILLGISSFFSVVSSLLVGFLITEGPYRGGVAKFRFENIKSIVRNKAMKLVAFGYFGHMWELYAFWVWIPIMFISAYEITNPGTSPISFVSLAVFGIFLVGAVGTGIGGRLSDKFGRTRFSIGMLVASGISSILIGFAFPDIFLMLIIALIWGLFIIPDSPQYSTMITELSDEKLMGTALTFQTSIGFFIAVISINLVPIVQEQLGWNFGFSFLFIGPIFGIIALLKLRRLSESQKIAHGKK